MDLFGFEIKRKEPQGNEKSFVAPSTDDAIESIRAGGYYDTYLDLEGVAHTESELVKRYRDIAGMADVDTAIEDIINELALRIDLIPVSMALAQAANESAWGTSRFTVEGNNVFGQRCYEEGCGIVPARRVSGAKHEVEYFDTVESSVKAYFLNINTHDSYAYLRDLRLKMRERNLKLDPMSLSIGLGRYSQRGSGYVDEIQRIILQNDLRDRDILF